MRHYFKKLTSIIIFVTYLYLVPLSFASDFSIDVRLRYDFLNENYTIVTIENSVTNLSKEKVLSSQILSTPYTDIWDVNSTSLSTKITPSATLQNGKDIKVSFSDPVVGEQVLYTYSVEYKTQQALVLNGLIKEIYIPKVIDADSINTYSVEIIAPVSYGMPNFISPNSGRVYSGSSSITLTFSNNEVTRESLAVFFGEYQIYGFDLVYDIENTGFLPKDLLLPIPPTIVNKQEVIISKTEPNGNKYTQDEDGNYFVTISTPPQTKMLAKVSGFAKVFASTHNSNESLPLSKIPKELISTYTSAMPFWDANNEDIKKATFDLGLDLQSPIYPNARAIYTFVTSHLKYQESEQDLITRKGAVQALREPNNSVCMEFSDLTVTLLRSLGIPARSIEGYAYSKDNSSRPLSVFFNKDVDYLHSWVEYYDNAIGWVSIDPTWGSTSKLDYFNNFDTNHLAFVIKGNSSTEPMPPGYYREQGDYSKKVFVTVEKNYQWDNSKILRLRESKQSIYEKITSNSMAILTLPALFLCGSAALLIFHLFRQQK